MFDNLEVLQMSQAMARHAGARQAIAARNLAHADTPGYKARDLVAFPQLVLQQQAQFGLRATRDMRVRIADLDLDVAFAAGEELATEISAKFTPATVDAFAAAAGFATTRRWVDPDARFALTLLTAA